jgi:putative aminopeptidase FrvX
MSIKPLLPLAALAIAGMRGIALAAGAEAPGARPGDDSMTCQQIAAELMPYMQQIAPSATAVAQTAEEVRERGKQRAAEEMPAAVALTMAATAASADPTGAASRAVGQAEVLHQQQVWQRATAEDKPLSDKLNAQTSQLAAQGQQLQSNARLQRLMQLVQEKGCDGK